MRSLLSFLGIIILAAVGYGIYIGVGLLGGASTTTPMPDSEMPGDEVAVDCARYEYYEDRMPQVISDIPFLGDFTNATQFASYYIDTQTGERVEVDDVPAWVEVECVGQIKEHTTY